MSSEEEAAPPLFLATLAGRSAAFTPDRPVSRSTPTGKERKIIVIGSAGVGKTSLVKREAYGEFDSSPQLTVGTERHLTTVEIKEEHIELALYDTVGQERFRTISSTLYRNTHAVLLCFDCSNRASFDAVDKWYLDVERNSPKDALILLVVTKVDLVRVVTQEECRQKASQLGIHLVETSAKTGFNVKALFALIASALSVELRRLRAQSSITAPESPTLGAARLDRLASMRRTESVSFGNVRVGRASSAEGEPAPSASSSSCWSFNPVAPLSRHLSASSMLQSPSLNPLPDVAMLPIPTPEDGLSLAEVVLEHANIRAKSVAGGLRRRNTIDPSEVTGTPRTTLDLLRDGTPPRKDNVATLEPFPEEESDSKQQLMVASSTSVTTTTSSSPKPTFRLCNLGCGALLEDYESHHETEECWLRQVPCSLGCGQSFAMLDCVAHEREACKLRTVRCACVQKLKAEEMVDHTSSYKGRSVALWSEVDVIHFIISVFPREQQRKLVNFAKILSDKVTGKRLVEMRDSEELHLIVHSTDQIHTLSSALSNFSFAATSSSSNNLPPQPSDASLANNVEYCDWEEEVKSAVESKLAGPSWEQQRNDRIMFGMNVVSAQRRMQVLSGAGNNNVMLLAAKRREKESNMTHEVVEVDEEEAHLVRASNFSRMWDSWHQQDFQPEKELRSDDAELGEEETTREVLVPLSLGSRTVAVRTIRFRDLHMNSKALVGSGSFGSVYWGRYRGAQVAVKHLHYQEIPERDLLREAAVMTSVSGHPHVLRFLGVCLERPHISFVSEALLCSLEDWLRRDKRANSESLSEILRFAEEAASGLYHLHLEMVVHRDIAARNLLLDSGNPRRVKVCDFGLARVLPRRNMLVPMDQATSQFAVVGGGGSLNLTGPLRWMSPESLRPGSDGLTRFSFATDVYSFAITVWELLSREVPYPALQPYEAAIAVITEDLRPPRAKMSQAVQDDMVRLLTTELEDGKFVSQLVALLERAWNKDPVKRPTMKEVVNELSLLRAASLSRTPQSASTSM